MVYDAAGDHQARVERATGDASQGVPCAVVEPIPEVVEAVLDEVLGRSKVEPGIDLVSGSVSRGRIVQADSGL